MAGKINQAIDLSPDFQEFMGKKKAARGDVTKKIWAYIRDNDLKDPDSGKVIFDDVLGDLLQAKSMSRASDLFGLLKKVEAFPRV